MIMKMSQILCWPAVLLLLALVSGCGQTEPGASLKLGRLGSLPAGAAGRASFSRLDLEKYAARYASTLAECRRIGQIEIPRIGLLFWIAQGTSKQSMTVGAGHIDGTPLPGAGGNFAVAGDRVLYGAPFLKLDQLRAGDKVILRMPYADLTYQVDDVTKVSPDDVSVLNPRGYDSITLSTCDPVWQVDQRIIVSGKLINIEVKPW